MGDKPPQWMLDAAAQLSTLPDVDSDGVEGWEFDPDGYTATWPEDDDPGWEVSLGGRLLTLEHGDVKFEGFTGGDVLLEARRLMAALYAYNGAP